MALFAFFFSWLWCWITGDRNAKHKKTKALPKWWSINQYKPLLFLPLAPTPTLKYVGDQQKKNKKNNCFQRNNNYMLVALFRPYNQTQTDRKKVAAAMKLMLCLTQEMESSSSFPLCTRVDTAHAGMNSLENSRRPTPLLPLHELSLLTSNDHTKRHKTIQFDSIRKKKNRNTFQPLVWPTGEWAACVALLT